ncbi:hypothetical protein HOK51_11340 [Candidatus Woesearchaeota archaeon]|jgi:hypothetical protein|nr:hypothetical protein [Candidatus Woesearchaeota archaeon]MBT6520416.1 hypothetical protein [Candidatus Woesearchaeota archaeon]MBT7368822.1 hypothetical protein [Candidatus Woesearchaeota archaeon]
MSIYKHLTEMESKIKDILVEFKRNNKDMLSEFDKILAPLILNTKYRLNCKLNKDNLKKLNADCYKKIEEFLKKIKKAEKDIQISFLTDLKEIFEKICELFHKSYVETEKLKKQIASFFKNNSQDNSLINLNKAFKDYDRRDTYLRHVFERVDNLINSNIKLLKASSKGRHIKSLFYSFNRVKKVVQIKFGDTQVNLEVLSGFNISRDKIFDKILHNYVLEGCNNALLKSNLSRSFEKWIFKLKNKKPKEMEEDLIELITNSLIYCLEKNWKLLRTGRVNLHVKILPENKMKSYLGTYSLKSTFSDIYISIRLTFGYLENYFLESKYLKEHTEEYNTLIHELTHAYDWRLNTDESHYSFVHNLIGADPLPETIVFSEVLASFKEEGLARMSGFLKSKFDGEFRALMFSFDDLFEDIEETKENVNKLFKQASSESSNTKVIRKNLKSAIKNGTCHDFGQYMAFIIILGKLFDDWTFWLCGKYDNMRDITERAINKGYRFDDIVDQFGWKIIKEDIGKYFKPIKGLNFAFLKKDYHKINQLFTLISLMKVPQFFNAYIKSGNKLGINPEPLTPKEFSKLNKQKMKQTQKLIHKMGF